VPHLPRRYDKDFSGTLEVDELQKAVRSTLKLSPQDMPDSDIEGLFGMLDLDDSETIEIDEFLIFLEQGPEAVLNPQGADAAAARQLAAEGEEGSEKKPSRGSRGSIDESPANDDEDGTRSRAMTASSAVSSSSQPVVQLQHTGPPIHRAVRDQNNRIMMNCGAGQVRFVASFMRWRRLNHHAFPETTASRPCGRCAKTSWRCLLSRYIRVRPKSTTRSATSTSTRSASLASQSRSAHSLILSSALLLGGVISRQETKLDDASSSPAPVHTDRRRPLQNRN
jgi:hypothetical protein